jgi:hypothetical protein
MVNQQILVYGLQSRLDSQDEKEKMTNQVLKLLHELKVRTCSTTTHKNIFFSVIFTVHNTTALFETRNRSPCFRENDSRALGNEHAKLSSLLCVRVFQAQSTDTFSLQAICEGGTRLRVAAVFFGLLVLQKEQAVELQQTTPYGDIMATPGSRFNHL